MTEPTSLVLLFPNTHRQECDLEVFDQKVTEDITAQELMEYIYHQYSNPLTKLETNETRTNIKPQDGVNTGVWGDEIPQKWEQIRLIHMGAALKPEMKLNQLKLDISNVIHVSCKPIILDTDQKGKKGKRSNGSIRTIEQRGGCCVIC
jgi:hypothetical protein